MHKSNQGHPTCGKMLIDLGVLPHAKEKMFGKDVEIQRNM